MGVSVMVFAVPTVVSEDLMNGVAHNAVYIFGANFFR